MSSLSASLLAQTIDDHITWMATWSRLACCVSQASAEALVLPESFSLWRREAAKEMQDQPALDRLVALFDQMHRAARLVLLKTSEGQTLSPHDYDSVSLKYQEFIMGLRRVERALAAAASGLDILTGLRSRSGMQEDLIREWNRFQRTGKPFCLALIDIDHFKKINDAHGHESGDRVLVAVANHISRSLRSFDDAWRWGGEEFLLCLKEVDLAAGLSVLERLRSSLEKTPIKISAALAVPVTASFGITVARPDVAIEALLEQTDKALYRAKEKGRNRVEAGE